MTDTLGTLHDIYQGIAIGSDLYRAPDKPVIDAIGQPVVWLGRSSDAQQAALGAFLDLEPIIRARASR